MDVSKQLDTCETETANVKHLNHDCISLKEAPYISEFQFTAFDESTVYREAVDTLKSLGINFFAGISLDSLGNFHCHGRFLERRDRLERVRFNQELIELMNGLAPEVKLFARSRKSPFALEANPIKSDTVSEQVMSFPLKFGYPAWQSLLCLPLAIHSDWKAYLFGCKTRLSRKEGAIASTIASLLSDFPDKFMPKTRPGLRALTYDELTCIEWAVKGKTLRDIADILGISVDAVRYRIKSVRDLYGLRNNLELIARVSIDYNLEP
ncbi:helix-turn-helix transcriptional regulator [Aestuariispira insulae]|uniref:DNA-binding CsgD family transcriptional regulator n=1 Tax=Aestuariispira insulae TaxID=1461337 RepID=A0A3D9H1K5_9PROT|nr:helix-turn-helix transcriptional regulator [Aestuariispira insulae]RED43389.1 DNA-binding CsgD family transcriptional regulator [Aestuariispira insulae]